MLINERMGSREVTDMKVGAINGMEPAYRELNPVDSRNIEKTAEKAAALQVNEIKEPVKPEQTGKAKPEVNDGRETIGVSKDGDVARASREAIENMNEGLVLKKSSEVTASNDVQKDDRQAVQNASQPKDSTVSDKAAEQKSTETNKADSLLGYSKSELERLYLQGEINSNQLNKELERREEIRGEKKEAAQDVKEDEKEEKKINEEIAVAMEANRENGVRNAADQQAEVTGADKAAGERQVQNVQEQRQADRVREENAGVEENSDETRKQIITEEIANDEQFAERMTVLAGAERNDEIVSDALDVAVENDRLKVMEQVLNVDPAMASNV